MKIPEKLSLRKVLTIAGSDPGGGAGIQADLKTFCTFKVYGMSVITSVTAQNTIGVQGIHDLPPEFIALQLESVLGDMGADATKTGMLSSSAIIHTVAKKLRDFQVTNLVVDPVMASQSGHLLLQKEAIASLREELIPIAYVITPNIPEAEVLSGQNIHSIEEMKQAARIIYQLGCKHVLIKGGHLDVSAVDILFDGKEYTEYRAAKISGKQVHGTGCTLSAAIAAGLALGIGLKEAIERAKEYITGAIGQTMKIGRGYPVLNHFVEL